MNDSKGDTPPSVNDKKGFKSCSKKMTIWSLLFFLFFLFFFFLRSCETKNVMKKERKATSSTTSRGTNHLFTLATAAAKTQRSEKLWVEQCLDEFFSFFLSWETCSLFQKPVPFLTTKNFPFRFSSLSLSFSFSSFTATMVSFYPWTLLHAQSAQLVWILPHDWNHCEWIHFF